MSVEEEVVQLRQENQSLRDALKQALEQLSQAREQLAVALERIQEWEKLKTPPPSFVKANAKKAQAEEKKARKKRDARHNQGRPRTTPTHIVEHRIVTCPTCEGRLGGMSVSRVREVIEIPLPLPVEVIHHHISKGWCSQCQHWHETPVDFSTEVLGQGRLGVRLISLIATLHSVMRLPVRPHPSAVVHPARSADQHGRDLRGSRASGRLGSTRARRSQSADAGKSRCASR